MKFEIVAPRVAIAGAALAVAGLAVAQSSGWAIGSPDSKHPILVVNEQMITMRSRLGQDIHRQINAYEDKVQSDLGPQAQALQVETQALEQQSGTLSDAARDKKMKVLQAAQAAYHEKLRDRQALVQGGELVARQHFQAQLTAVVDAIMSERGADAIIQKSSIVASVSGLDITNEVIQRLDHREASFKVPLVNPPASSIVPLQ